jgi:hypothetical protein
MTYRVIEKLGWSYGIDEDGCDIGEFSGPWRYRHDAQEYADELNARDGEEPKR